MPTLSVLIHTKNSAATLKQALKSVQHLASEVIVIDMMSHDQTVEIAHQAGAKVFSHKDVGFVEPARNFGLSKVSGDWVFILDADEEVSPGLKEFLHSLIKIEQADLADCYYVPRQNLIFGKWVKTGWWPDYQLRLFRQGQVTWQDEIHSIPITSGKVAELPADLDYSIIHHNYQTVDQYIDRLNRYTRIESQQQLENPRINSKKLTASRLIQDFNDELLRRLFAERGIEEGLHGVGLSYLQSMFQLVTTLKIWQQKQFPPTTGHKQAVAAMRQLRQLQQDLNYWMADYMIQHTSGIPQWWWRIRRKAKI